MLRSSLEDRAAEVQICLSLSTGRPEILKKATASYPVTLDGSAGLHLSSMFE